MEICEVCNDDILTCSHCGVEFCSRCMGGYSPVDNVNFYDIEDESQGDTFCDVCVIMFEKS
jgi:hypothetical protein